MFQTTNQISCEKPIPSVHEQKTPTFNGSRHGFFVRTGNVPTFHWVEGCCFISHDGSVCMPYMVTFTINIPQMLASIYQHHGSYMGIDRQRDKQIDRQMGWFRRLSIAMLDQLPEICNMLITSQSIHETSSGAESEYALLSNMLVRICQTQECIVRIVCIRHIPINSSYPT